MIVSIAVGLIGALVVLANYRHLRKPRIFIIAVIATSALVATGIYFIRSSGKADKEIFLVFFAPFVALFLFQLIRAIFKRYRKQEIILYMKGFYPLRHEERFVSRLEVTLTFIITALSVAIPYFILLWT